MSEIVLCVRVFVFEIIHFYMRPATGLSCDGLSTDPLLFL